MRCPNCGANFQKTANICFKCGTKLSQIQNASSNDVIKAKKEYQPEKIVYSTVFPKDISYIKTLLLCIFLGAFGAHRYYTKRYLSAAILSFCMVTFLVFWSIIGLIFEGNTLVLNINMSNDIFNFFTSITALMGASSLLVWAFDIIKIATKTFKIPVVLSD